MEHNKVLTPELKEKLSKMGGLGFTENKEFLYSLKEFRKKDENGEYEIPKEFWPVFKLLGKDSVENAKLEDGLGHMEFEDKSDTRKWISKSGTRKLDLCRDGIKGFHTYFDIDGIEIPYRQNGTKINDKTLSRIKPEHLTELSNVIAERNVLTEEELTGLEF